MLGGLAVGGVLAAREVRRSGWGVARARVRRTRRLTWLAIRRAAAAARLGLPGGADRGRLDEFHVHTAEQAFKLLGDMKGVAMKLGQMASLLSDGLPEAYAEGLKGLQQAAPPMAPGLVSQVVEEELGGPPEAVFYEFSAEPVAAASIGQVHRARLFDGTPVAVKVQYPGVDVAIRADLDNALLLTTLAKAIAPGIEPGPFVDELRARIGDELDYRKEAAHQDEFGAAFLDHPWVRIPEVLHEFSSARVLTSEWAEGESLYEILDRSQEEKDLVGEELFRFWCDAVFRLRLFNGDPHPGNYFFGAGGRSGPTPIWFLDFGLVKRFSPGDTDALREQILALRSGDPAKLLDVMVRFGWLRENAPVDQDRVAELAELALRSAIGPGPFTFTREYVASVVQASLVVSGPYSDVVRYLTLPPQQVLLNRIHLGLSALLARLGATGDWAGIMDEYILDTPPSTALGEAGAAWPTVGPAPPADHGSTGPVQ